MHDTWRVHVLFTCWRHVWIHYPCSSRIGTVYENIVFKESNYDKNFRRTNVLNVVTSWPLSYRLLAWLLNTDVSCSSVETGPSCCCLCSQTLAHKANKLCLVNSHSAPPAHVAIMAKLTRLTLLWHCQARVVAGALYRTSLLINLMLINLFERNHTKWITQLSTCSEYKSTCSSLVTPTVDLCLSTLSKSVTSLEIYHSKFLEIC